MSQDPSLLPPHGHYGEEHDYHHEQHQARFVSQDPASQNPLDLQVKDGVWDGLSYDDGDADGAERSLRHAHKLSSKRILDSSPSEPTSKRRKQQHVPRDYLLEINSEDEYIRRSSSPVSRHRKQRGRRRGTSAERIEAPNGLDGNDPNASDGVSEGFGSRLPEEEEQILESLHRKITSSKKGKVRLLKKSGVSVEQRRIVRKAYRKLQGNVCRSHQGDKIEDPMSQAAQFALERNNFLFQLTKYQREGVMDAETLDQIGRRAARQIDKLTHVPRYDIDRFIGQLHKKLGVLQGGSRYFDWRTLGREAGVCFNAVPSRVAFLHGPATADYIPKERKKREQRTSSAEDDGEDDGDEQPDELKHTADQKACGALSTVEQQVKSTAEQLVKRSKEARQEAMKVWESSSVQLSKDEKKKRKKLIASRYGLEIDMLEFIVDRTSFTKTVENLFHLSFLVKDGKAGVRARSEEEAALYGGPVSGPVVRAVPNEMSNRANWANPPRQCIISLNMSEWRELCMSLDEE